MNLEKKFAIRDLARVIVTVCDKDTIATLMNDFLCVEADERLSDYQVELGELLFDGLTAMRPELVELAQTK